MKESVKIGNQTVVISYDEDLLSEIDIDRILQIDFQRLPAEMVTFPVILNRLGMLLADANNDVKAKMFDLETYIAKKRESIRNELNDVKKHERMTQEDIKYRQESELKTDGVYNVKTKQLHKLKTKKHIKIHRLNKFLVKLK